MATDLGDGVFREFQNHGGIESGGVYVEVTMEARYYKSTPELVEVIQPVILPTPVPMTVDPTTGEAVQAFPDQTAWDANKATYYTDVETEFLAQPIGWDVMCKAQVLALEQEQQE